MNLSALMQWITLGQSVVDKGAAAMAAVKAAAAAHGIEQDTAALDAVILDAERRKAIAQHEAQTDTGSDVPGGGASD